MEKQRMDRRKRFPRIGLLILFILLSSGFSIADEDDILDLPSPDEQVFDLQTVDVKIESFPASPIVKNPWSVQILVNHPNPDEVNIDPPELPPSLALERIKTEPKLVNEDEQWTSIEFIFTPAVADAFTLGPFEVTTPDGQFFSGELTVSFREETILRSYEPRFRWLGPAPTASPGRKTELALELANWDTSKKIPQGLFQGRAPMDVILEEAPPLAVGGGVYHYRIHIIPMVENDITLQPFFIRFDIYNLYVPRISVRVLEGARESSSASSAPADASFDASARHLDGLVEIPFPENREKIFFLFQGEYDRIVARVRALWEENLRAEALAEIRRNERDSLSGPFLISQRKEIEQRMSLGFTENESWRPLRIPAALYVFLFTAILVTVTFLVVLRFRGDTSEWIQAPLIKKAISRRGGGIINAIILVLAVGLLIIFLEEGLGNFPFGRYGSTGNTAVLKSTQGYMIPDFKGSPLDWFEEGQPVIVGDYIGDWCLAETHDGRSGWVLRESVISY